MEKPVQPEQAASDQPKQKTLRGLEIPLPKRGEIMKAFEKIAKPKKG
jgi:hypothetical protein